MNAWRERDARSQALFREVNEQIERLQESFGTDGQAWFLCECRNPECTQGIGLTRVEYGRLREHANRFAIAPNHENPEAETIVEENDRFAVVESYAGEASRIARETDPRSQAHIRERSIQRAEPAPEGSR
jgi:hypothetical protein